MAELVAEFERERSGIRECAVRARRVRRGQPRAARSAGDPAPSPRLPGRRRRAGAGQGHAFAIDPMLRDDIEAQLRALGLDDLLH